MRRAVFTRDYSDVCSKQYCYKLDIRFQGEDVLKFDRLFASLEDAFTSVANDYGCVLEEDDRPLPPLLGWELAPPFHDCEILRWDNTNWSEATWHGVVDGEVWYSIQTVPMYLNALTNLSDSPDVVGED